VVPLAPGDAADIAARALGEEISRLLKTPVLSINRPGAGGAVGTNSVVQARKDGHTILFAQNSALTFRAVLDPQSVTYDALRDLVPLGTASRTPSVLVVRSDAPYKNFAELIEYAKKKPGQVRIGHPGSGSVGDFCVQSINALTGAELVPIPYAGAAPAIVARGGTSRRRAVAQCAERAPQVRGTPRPRRFEPVGGVGDVPSLRELGYQRSCSASGSAFSKPTGIPEEAGKALVSAIEQAVRPPPSRRLASLGILQAARHPSRPPARCARAQARGQMAGR
jgi:tripartite-type tricarboxylate transporter receptor subunit TctC